MHFFNHYHVLFLMNNLDSSSKSNTNSTVHKFLALFWRRKLLESGRTRQTISLAKQHEGPAMISKVERSCTPVLTGRNTGREPVNTVSTDPQHTMPLQMSVEVKT